MRHFPAGILTALAAVFILTAVYPAPGLAADPAGLAAGLPRHFSGYPTGGADPFSGKITLDFTAVRTSGPGEVVATGRCQLDPHEAEFDCELRLDARGLRAELRRFDPPDVFPRTILTGHLTPDLRRLDMDAAAGGRVILDAR